jgi:hypothetical protein
MADKKTLNEMVQNHYRLACENGMGLTFAAKCAAEVASRIDAGLSHDCDDYRELTRWAKGETR